jgi:hypothetical protein
MSISESKNGEEKATTRRSAKGNVTVDIEEALSFIDSEEYQGVRDAIPAADTPIARIQTAQPPQQKSSTDIKPRPKKTHRPSPVRKEPTKKGATPVKGEKSKKSGKIWLLTLSISVLVVLAILFFYTMG